MLRGREGVDPARLNPRCEWSVQCARFVFSTGKYRPQERRQDWRLRRLLRDLDERDREGKGENKKGSLPVNDSSASGEDDWPTVRIVACGNCSVRRLNGPCASSPVYYDDTVKEHSTDCLSPDGAVCRIRCWQVHRVPELQVLNPRRSGSYVLFQLLHLTDIFLHMSHEPYRYIHPAIPNALLEI